MSYYLGNRLRMGKDEQLDGVRACTVGIAGCDVAYARVRVVQSGKGGRGKWQREIYQ